jgi:hypothetical protein
MKAQEEREEKWAEREERRGEGWEGEWPLCAVFAVPDAACAARARGHPVPHRGTSGTATRVRTARVSLPSTLPRRGRADAAPSPTQQRRDGE